MNNNKIHVWSHMDLDGVVSYMILKWYFNKSVPATFTTVNRFKEDFEKFVKDGGLEKNDKIFVLDLDVSGFQELVDHEKVFIYDHHTTNNANYQFAKGGVKECTSCAKLLFQLFTKLPNSRFSEKQKKLVDLADDYDSYTLDIPESYNLNVIFFESQNKPWNFISNFEVGFDGFNELQQNIIYLHQKKLHRIITGLPAIYKGDVKIQNKERRVVATFAEACINEVAEHLITGQSAEVAIVVNPKSNHISFRKKKESDVDVSKIAETLCGGGGRAETAGGEITDKFQTFSKLLHEK